MESWEELKTIHWMTSREAMISKMLLNLLFYLRLKNLPTTHLTNPKHLSQYKLVKQIYQ